jgi:hypothetical protein
VGYFSSSNEKEPAVSALKIISDGQTLTDAVNKHRVEKIVVALSERRGGSMPMRELLDCKVNGIQVIDIATHFEQFLGANPSGSRVGWLADFWRWIQTGACTVYYQMDL